MENEDKIIIEATQPPVWSLFLKPTRIPDTIKGSNTVSFDHAVEWAKTKGSRLFTKAEAMWMLEKSQRFRDNCFDIWLWVIEGENQLSQFTNNAWVMNGRNGLLTHVQRTNSYAARCLGPAIWMPPTTTEK